MNATADALRTLHRIHQQLHDLNDRRERGPRQVRAGEKSVANLNGQLDQVTAATRDTRVAADEKQLNLRSIEGKIADWKAKLNSCSSNKEYQALLEQIAAAEMAGSVLSDEILELFERIDGFEEAARQAKEQVHKAAQSLDDVRQRVTAEAGAIAADIDRLNKELATAEAALPADFRADYQRVIHAQGADGLAAVDGTFCGGCFQELTPNAQNSLALGKSVFCSACGRLLYLAESQANG